jgi:hypothetical protein
MQLELLSSTVSQFPKGFLLRYLSAEALLSFVPVEENSACGALEA